MFDRCEFWRRELTLRADGTLNAVRQRKLEAHLAGCTQCRQAAQADRQMRAALDLRVGRLGAEASEAFDDQVLAALSVPVEPPRRFAVDFFSQMTGGALLAASITAFVLSPALHLQAPSPVAALQADRAARAATQRQSLPVSLESLMSSPAPRAALLWSPPPADSGSPLRPPSAVRPSGREQPVRRRSAFPERG